MKLKLSNSQQEELELLTYFMPTCLSHIKISDDDIKKYFEWSQNGKHKKDIKLSHFSDGFNALVTSKSYRYINIGLYQDGIGDGCPYNMLLGGEKGDTIVPVSVKNFLKKTMFKGIDAELIEERYQRILVEKNKGLVGKILDYIHNFFWKLRWFLRKYI